MSQPTTGWGCAPKWTLSHRILAKLALINVSDRRSAQSPSKICFLSPNNFCVVFIQCIRVRCPEDLETFDPERRVHLHVTVSEPTSYDVGCTWATFHGFSLSASSFSPFSQSSARRHTHTHMVSESASHRSERCPVPDRAAAWQIWRQAAAGKFHLPRSFLVSETQKGHNSKWDQGYYSFFFFSICVCVCECVCEQIRRLCPLQKARWRHVRCKVQSRSRW